MRWISLVLMMLAGTAWADPQTLAAINAARGDNGRDIVVYNARLESVARAHAEDMAANGFFSHTGSDGSDIGARLTRGGYRWCFAAENIAAGQRSLTEVMSSWMGSRGHSQNILHRKAQAVGMARVTGDLWVMVLAAPC